MKKQRHILDRPHYGWSSITLGEWEERCSYLDDVPFLLLDAAEQVISTERPVAVEFDAEGWEYIIVFCPTECYVILKSFGESTGNLFHSDLCIEEVARLLVDDINHDFDDWVWWNYPAETEASAAEREYRLRLALSRLDLKLRHLGWRKERGEVTEQVRKEATVREDKSKEITVPEIEELEELLKPRKFEEVEGGEAPEEDE